MTDSEAIDNGFHFWIAWRTSIGIETPHGDHRRTQVEADDLAERMLASFRCVEIARYSATRREWHALKFLKPDGHLLAIMSAGTEFRETRKSEAFRETIAGLKGLWRDMPAGSFSSAGTNCNTILLSVWKDGRHHYW